ncbi:Transcriptional regulator, Crp/Fnr family [hydrothermal vent metagenome]|uniref:Transcriptional regulator, Crp/Fnr family n=1 Tax=hydrothermal vent metagenome TaxID=652676 RepID=A0A3B0T2Z4_9ZZZZ
MALDCIEDRNVEERTERTHGVCSRCLVRNRAVCDVLESEQQAELAAITRHVVFQAGQIIVAEAEDKEIVGTIIRGVVKLTKTLSDGREQIVGLLFPSDFLGRVREGQSQVFGEAVGEVEVCLFNTVRFRQLIKRFPELRNALYDRALNELDVAREWMVLLGRKSAREKIATFLVMLARRSQKTIRDDNLNNCPIVFSLPMSRADIADYLGLTIETVSRQITMLKTGGAIRMLSGRDILVPDLGRLEALAEGEMN